MIRSCLIEPLVKPLVKPLVGKNRRTALAGSAFCATALCLSALAAVTTNADAPKKQEHVVKPNAHKLAAKVQLRLHEVYALYAKRDDVVEAPSESADFDHEAVLASRLRHCLDRTHDGGGLMTARRLDRVLGSLERSTFWLFGSGQHLSAVPV